MILDGFQLTVFDYLQECCLRKIALRGVGVVTPEQFLFYTQLDKERDDRDHFDLLIELEKLLHPSDYQDGFDALRKEDVFFYSSGDFISVYLPVSGVLYEKQYQEVFSLLEEVNQFNQTGEKRIPVCLMTYSPSEKIEDVLEATNSDEIDEMKRELSKYFSRVKNAKR